MSEDPWDDWETAADAGLIDCKVPTVKKSVQKPTELLNKELWERANAYSVPTIIHTNNDSGRTEYKPELKILKRPESLKNARAEAIIKKPLKKLADREKEYEEAKRKIDEKFNSKKPQ